jgi:arylsulfatase A-like enzyme
MKESAMCQHAINRRSFLKFMAGVLAGSVLPWRMLQAAPAQAVPADKADKAKPNIVFILADDLGYGDVQCLNPKRGKIPTPNIDRLAGQGVTFTESHSGSAVCSPTRYGVLTGRYSWRVLIDGIVGVYGKPLIAPDRLTVPGLLRQNGYQTACVGKWHLGWDWPRKGKDPAFDQPVPGGPTDRGFDYYFGVDVPNWPPYCWIENDRLQGNPTEQLGIVGKNINSKPGAAMPGWKFEPILPTITDKVCQYIQKQAKSDKPFFLYFPLTAPHTPLSPTDDWKGKSGLNVYADLVMEVDAMVGRVLDTLDKAGVAENTLVIFTSDNGMAPYAGAPELEAKGHYPSGEFRGYKADAWDGGHHVPFFARWPGVTKAGATCRQLTCHTDLLATCAEIVGAKLPDSAGEDSISILPLLKGRDAPIREAVVHHSASGRFAIRQGKWKLLLCAGSGGWAKPGDAEARQQGLPDVQLYDMDADIGERVNLQDKHPEIVAQLTALLQKYADAGRSTPGAPRENDVPVDIFKKPRPAAATKPK